MRIYKNCLEMIKEVERDLYEMGISYQSQTVQDKDVDYDKNYETLELPGYCYKITDVENSCIDKMLEYINSPLSLDWVKEEFGERIDHRLLNPGSAYKLSNLWNDYIHKNLFSYTYNERFRDQLFYLIKELNIHMNTRQAVLTVYDKHSDLRNSGGIKRIPCSMHYQFVVRNGRLHIIYVMRSCDFLKHFASDVALAIYLQRYVRDNIESFLSLGTFTHFIGSLHAFKKDLDVRKIF